MKKAATLILCLALAAAALTAQPVNKQQAPKAVNEKQQMPGPGIMKALQLNDDQTKQFQKLASAMQKETIDLKAKIATARVDMRDLFAADAPDQAAIEKKMTEINGLQMKQKLAHLNFWFAVNKTLTPEQQKIWKRHLGKMERERMMRERCRRMQERGARMQHPGGPMGMENGPDEGMDCGPEMGMECPQPPPAPEME